MRLDHIRLRASAATLFLAAAPAMAVGQITDRTALVAALDSAARAYVTDSLVAGASVAVVRGADTLLMKGYGFADLEWGVPTPPDGRASYEIGSMTKQFTAAAVLQLVDDGKLDLDADMTTYLPDYDTQGHSLPLRRLLDHTSGIQGYTEMPMFGDFTMRKLPRDSLVARFEKEPFQFEPGTAEIYNNSAFFLLGLIIEKVSGQSYADYVTQHLFRPTGMTRSYYCSESAIRKDRAHGYDMDRSGLRRMRYLDQTWPFSAGSLCSTVGDLIAWNQALHHGKVLPASAYALLTTPEPLKDGTPIRYAMGLTVDDTGGRRIIAHSGGINGFRSDGQYYPDADLTVIVLQNTASPRDPGALGHALANLVLGPAPVPATTAYDGDLNELLGTYAGPARGMALTVEVTRDGDQLVLDPSGPLPEMRPDHWSGLTWGQGTTQITFHRVGGHIARLDIDQEYGHYVLIRSGG